MSEYLKSILAFVSLVATNVATQIAIDHQPLPNTWQDGLRWAVSILAGTWLVYQVPNQTDRAARAVGRSVRMKGEKPIENLPDAA